MYRKVSEKTGLKKYQVIDIFKSQFDLVAIEMGKLKGTKIRIPFIGIFEDNEKRRNSIINKRKKDGKQN